MKKKFTAMLLMLIMCLSVFAGCSLITRNDKKYYEAVVCTISYADGTSDSITKRELLMGYNSYGYNYVQNYGYTAEQAVMTTLDTIVNQHITIKAVKDYYSNPDEILLDSEKTYLYDTTYSSMYNNLLQYYLEVTEGTENTPEDSVQESKSVFKQYQRQAYLQEVKGKLVIKKEQSATTIRETYKARYDENKAVLNLETDASKELLYSKLYSLCGGNTAEAKNWKKAFTKYVKDIKANYNYKYFADDKACLLFEIDRVYQILRDNYYVEKYNVIFNQQQHQGDNTSNVTVNDVLKYYSSKVRADYNKYKADTSAFEKDVLNDIANVDYILEGDNASEYFYVGYVKINLTEEQKSQIESIKNNPNISNEDQRQAEINKVYAAAKATVRDAKTGAETTQKVDASVLHSKIKSEVETHTTDLDRANAFRPYMYLYSDDDTLKGADFNTVFGVNIAGEVLCSDAFSSDNVKEAIKDLYNNGNAKVGDMTDLVQTDDGIYMFFYAGEIENLFAVTENFDVSNNEDNIKILASAKQNIFSDKTIFDTIYETLAGDNFSIFQNMNIQNLRSNLVADGGIKAIKNNIKDLF